MTATTASTARKATSPKRLLALVLAFAAAVALAASVAPAAAYAADPIVIDVTRSHETLTFDLGGGTLDGKTGTVTIEANVGDIINLPGAPEGCIAFTSDAPFEVSLGFPDSQTWNGTIQCSLDDGEWKDYTAGTKIGSGDGCAVYFRGTGNTGISKGGDASQRSTFSLAPAGGHTVSCSGNAEALLDYEAVLHGGHPVMGKYAFGGLFSGCEALDSAPALPATTLADGCYYDMFSGCEALDSAPALPATTLADSCYSCMFIGCTSLEEAPELPATVLADNCYLEMFWGCTALEAAPELPAETLADGCYCGMFEDCTALEEAPALPATVLAGGCYDSMFRGCTALAKAPALPATTLADSCYLCMFIGCTSLEEAPELPATVLADNCYYGMFYGCTSLASPPALPAEKLADNCYKRMFEKSGVRLSDKPGVFAGVPYGTPYRIPSEGTGTGADGALTDMFLDAAGPFKGTPAIGETYYLPGTPEGCIAFTSDEPFEVSLGPDKHWDGRIEYSINGSTWLEYSAGTSINSDDGCAVFFRGTDNTRLGEEVEDDVYRRSTFSLTPAAGHTVSCSGNIETLLDYEKVKNGEHPTMGKIAFYRLFYGCTSLASAPELPAETLSDGCYENMFYECTSLTEAPALPAKTLASRCYCDMFEDCTSLKKAPALPAETLAASCYQSMFRGCTSLEEAPALPAETLADGCYYRMFLGCTALTSAPALPAKTLAASCYNGMFYGCTSLTEAPELPVEKLAATCYEDMFLGCTSLTEAPALPATTLTKSCYYRMFYGCTSLTEAPALPATGLADSCYKAMFYRCTSLTKAPALPAEKLFAVDANGTVTQFGGCYAGMFGGCTSLTEAPALPAKEMVYNCYDRMFMGCTSLTTPPALPAEKLADNCYKRMFERSGVRLSEEPGAFDGVFYGTPYRIPSEGTGTDADSALADMFAGTGGPFEGGTPVINKTYYLPATPVDAPVGKTLPYTGAEQTGVDSGKGYTLTGETATDAGGHTATATLQDGYAWSDGTVGAKDVPWEITPAAISEATVSAANQIYDGTELEPLPTVIWNGTELKQGADYTVAYRGNMNAGTATVIVEGTNNFEGKATTTFEIAKRKVTFSGCSEVKDYTGSQIEISTVAVEGLIDGHTHNVTFSAKGIDVGPYEGTITAEDAVAIKSGDTDVTGNYDVSVANGKLTIEQDPQLAFEVSLADDEYTYDGNPHSSAKTPSSTAKSGETAFSYSLVEAGPYVSDLASLAETEAGAYTIYVRATNPNYAGEATTTAKLTINPRKKGTLTFDLRGGVLDGQAGIITIEANVGDTVNLPGAPTRKGYTFRCWRGSEYAAGAEYTVEGDHAFAAEWEKDAPAAPNAPAAQNEPADPKLAPTGDASSAALGELALAAIASLCVLAGCAIRRREG